MMKVVQFVFPQDSHSSAARLGNDAGLDIMLEIQQSSLSAEFSQSLDRAYPLLVEAHNAHLPVDVIVA
ncbi:MAG: hypothetical protein AAFX93_15520 [Verrucomicrobiota bacterium]